MDGPQNLSAGGRKDGFAAIAESDHLSR